MISKMVLSVLGFYFVYRLFLVVERADKLAGCPRDDSEMAPIFFLECPGRSGILFEIPYLNGRHRIGFIEDCFQ